MWRTPRACPLHAPPPRLQIRWVFGDVTSVRVSTTLTIDRRGLVVAQVDRVHAWLAVPLPLRVLLGLAVPALITLARPA